MCVCVQLYGFSSARKMASVLMKRNDNSGAYRLFNKGAAEWVLKRCVAVLNPDGTTSTLDAARQAELLETVTQMAKRVSRHTHTHTHTRMHTHSLTHIDTKNHHILICCSVYVFLCQAEKRSQTVCVCVYVCVCRVFVASA